MRIYLSKTVFKRAVVALTGFGGSDLYVVLLEAKAVLNTTFHALGLQFGQLDDQIDQNLIKTEWKGSIFSLTQCKVFMCSKSGSANMQRCSAHSLLTSWPTLRAEDEDDDVEEEEEAWRRGLWLWGMRSRLGWDTGGACEVWPACGSCGKTHMLSCTHTRRTHYTLLFKSQCG